MNSHGRRDRQYLLRNIVVVSLILGMGAVAMAAERSPTQIDVQPIADRSSKAVVQTDGVRAAGIAGESAPLSSGSPVKECGGEKSPATAARALVRRLAGKPTPGPGPGQCPPGETGLLERMVE
jgi:hypothetical protein